MEHGELRRLLIEELLAESPRYRGTAVPTEKEEQKRLLRGLMNLRRPGPVSEDFLRRQDEYLTAAIEERGITDVRSLPVSAEGFSLWQGDITLLRCDAIVNAANSGMTGCYVQYKLFLLHRR